MSKIFIALTLIMLIWISTSQSQRRVAKIDEIQIDLQNNQTKQLTQATSKHFNQAFMVNVQYRSVIGEFGHIEIQLQNKKKDKVTCIFKYANNLCVLQQSTQQVSIKLKCLQQKCKYTLSLSNRVLYTFKGINNHKSKMLTVPGQIYKLQKQKFNSLVEIHMETRQEKLRQQDVTVYSNVHVFRLSQIEQLSSNNIVFGIKPIIEDNDQYIYIEGDQNQKTKQLRALILTHEGTIQEGITIVDFIQTFGRHSKNNYNFAGTFNKNIQVKARVFAPKNKILFFSITVSGKNNAADNFTTISTLNIDPIDFKTHSFQDITFIITKSQHKDFKFINFQLKIQKLQDKAVFIQLGVSDVSISDIFIFDDVYFSTGEKEEVNFVVAPQVKYEMIGKDNQITIVTNAKQRQSVNLQTCSLHKGCQLYIKSQIKCSACSFKFNLKDRDIKNQIIYYKVKDNHIQAKIDFEQQLFFKYTVSSQKFIQIVVNSPNVMVYAKFQSYSRCKIPTSVCHQYVINQQNPIIVYNNKNISQDLIVSVVGLQKTPFNLRFIQENAGLKVGLAQKFSYLFDNQQTNITVHFVSDNTTFKQSDQHLNFNLISPINSLLLTVTNVGGFAYSSNDGYIEFPKKDIFGSNFQITIVKIGAFIGQFVHMTLIVTTANSGIRLDSTNTHYEKYLPQTQKKFFMEYDPSQENAISIYTQNLERTRSTMKLIIQDVNLENVDEEKKPFIEKILERDIQVIDLDRQLQNLDICQEINCELQIRIKSQSKQQLQQSITIIHEESVILLDDSIWNSFQINQLSINNHFYYLPRGQNSTIKILFNTEDKNLFIDYIIHNTKNGINPQNWPWQHHSSNSRQEIVSHLTGFQEFKIPSDNPELVDCMPDCAIMITVFEVKNQAIIDPSRQLIKKYKILVSSTIIQVPEDTKFQVTMQTGQQNAMFVELKNFLKSQQLTFFTQYKVGKAKVTATLINKGIQYKLKTNEKDFVFQDIETHLPISSITNILSKNNLKTEETSLKLNFLALSNVKFYFEFTSYLKSFYRLNMDDLEIVTLRQGEQVWYEFIPQRDFSIKFYRAKGFPLFKIIKCQEDSYIDCLTKQKKLLKTQVNQKLKLKQQLKQDIQKPQKKKIQINQQHKQSTGKQLEIFIQKNYQYTNQECQNCMIFIWIYCYAQELQLSINIRSSASQIQLRQMAVVNDRIQKKEKHTKYLINVEPDTLTLVTFRIIQGLCKLQIEDSSFLLHNKTYNTETSDYQDITIPALGWSQKQIDEKPEESSQYDGQNYIPNIPNVIRTSAKSDKHHVLRHIHVKVTALSEKPIQYLLSYSIGFSGLYLQDGIVSQKLMAPDIPHTYYYRNKDKTSHAYLSLSSSVVPGYSEESSKNQYEPRFFYYPDASDSSKKQQFRPEMPPKKNQNFFGQTITHVYELPSKFQLYQIQIYTKNFIKIVASINHKQIVYLPIGYQYLIKLHSNQSIYLVVDRPQTEYLQLSIKKCDTSVPSLLYTNDAKEFQQGIYETKEQLISSYEKKLIRTKKDSKTIHLKLIAQQFVQSLFTVTVSPQMDPKHTNTQKMKPGNKGLLSYTTLDANKIQIQFSPLMCDSKLCLPVVAHYYLLLAPTIDNIYGQLNCAGSYFIPQASNMFKYKAQVFQISLKYYDKETSMFRYTLKLQNEQQFIGVKAVYVLGNKKLDAVYVPTEITTLWKQVSKLSIGIVLVFSCVLAVLLTTVVVISTKVARRGYRPIAENQ